MFFDPKENDPDYARYYKQRQHERLMTYLKVILVLGAVLGAVVLVVSQ